MPSSPTTALAADGPIARALGASFESRPQQLEMASAVGAAMASRSKLLVEAGTGVGKSFAYLVPAIIRAAEHGETVLVATNTISLQEQLIEKDIPLLLSILYPEQEEHEPPVRPVLVKGRGNYVSIRRLKLASDRSERLLPDPAARRSLEVIQDWAYATLDGTLSTLPPVERMGVWDKVQSDSANCMGRRCPNYDACFYQNARAKLENANLLVCNHALFFSDLALRSQEAGFLPNYHHVILDEAHGIEETAADHFGLSLSEGRVVHLLNTLHSGRSGRGYLSQLSLLLSDSSEVQRAVSLVEQAHSATRAFFDGLLELVRKSAAGSENPFASARGAASGSVRLREPGLVANVLTPAFRDLALRLKAMREGVKNEADRFELNAYGVRAENIALEAESLVSQLVPAAAYWAESSGGEDDGDRGGGPRVTLACSPIEVAPLLKERLFSQDHSVVLTSATLATRLVKPSETGESAETAFAHVLARLGAEGAKTLQMGSPFDYRKQVEFIIHPGADSTSRGSGDLSPMAAAILEHVDATAGGAFVLFTSFATLNRCASELAGPLARRGFPLLAQGRDGPRGLILKRFREHDASVLFGAASFWQGVDVRGRGLRNVIITKLPFDPPDRPLTQARYELIESRGGNPFMEDSLPRAVIKFKQGFGRLIRSAEDRGRVVVLDSRLVTARYARYFLSALPEGVRPRVRGSDVDE
ncbi:MAG: ATP-dependent DNA helicase [Phycisphaerales bacterium]